MSQGVASLLVLGLQLYLGLGVLVALAFVTRGVGRIDPAARQGSWGFRVLIFPASVALWPWALLRWRRGGPPPVESNPHRDRARRESGA